MPIESMIRLRITHVSLILLLVGWLGCSEDEATGNHRSSDADITADSGSDADGLHDADTTVPGDTGDDVATGDLDTGREDDADDLDADDPDADEPDADDPDADDPDNDGTLITLFDEEVDLEGGLSQSIPLEVPDDIWSLSITITDGPVTADYTVNDWFGPDNFPVVREGWAQTTQTGICYPDCNTRVVLGPGAAAALAPNNPASLVEAGAHSFRIFGGSIQDGATVTTTVRVQVHAKLVSNPPPTTGVLDLNFFFTGANDWTAETAPTDPEFQDALTDFEALYAPVGITFGDISYHNVDPSYQIIESISGGASELGQLFEESENATLDGPSIFIVDELRAGFGGVVVGISGGIPGPVLTHGTPSSGIALSYGSIPADSSLAKLMAHHMGLFLGLFRTSESITLGDIPAHDPLPDTPEDDTDYLMHPALTGEILSDWQGRVMRKNPWIRHP